MNKRFVLFVFPALFISGCVFNPAISLQQKTTGKVTEKTIENQTGGKTDINSKEGQLPSNFPKDVPIYPGAKPAGSWTSTTKDERGVLVTLETNDGKNKVVSFYSAELPKNGWTIETTTNTDEGVMYIIKKNTRTGWVTITAEKNGKTTIGIVVGDQQGESNNQNAGSSSSPVPEPSVSQ